MNTRTKNKLTGLGFDSMLIQKIATRQLTVSGLRGMSKNALQIAGFTVDEANTIATKVNRSSIDTITIVNIVLKSGGICCYCSDGNSSKPYQIHHIEEYHIGQNHQEENLLLVCPTHHAQIHRDRTSIGQQLNTKRKWENLWKIAKLYVQNGIVFPFGSIEFIDYQTTGSITEIFNFSAPRPAVCVQVSKGRFVDDSLKILGSENKLVISGHSGSGKTTMVYGIAGSQNAKDVYKYNVADNSNISVTSEILMFLSQAINVILIVDDANTNLDGNYIERILSAADSKRQIIVVNTRNDFKGENEVEEHFVNSVKYISWKDIRSEVKATLLEEEAIIVDYLKEKELVDINSFPLGHSELDMPLNIFIERYVSTSETVWQFIYLIGGGLKKVGQIKTQLNQNDRFDLIFLHLSIMQIAQFEKGCNIEEILIFYKNNNVLNKQPVPEKEWLQSKLDELCLKRYVKNERGRYKTIHRQLALKYIEEFYLAEQQECSEVLDVVFRDYSNVKEIAILWSWINNSAVKSYLVNWAKSTDFNSLVENACYENLNILSIIARLMHTTAQYQKHAIVFNAFANRSSEIAEIINSEEVIEFYQFSQLLSTLKSQVPEIIPKICGLINKENFLKSIVAADPKEFQYISNCFYYFWEEAPEWVLDFTKMIDERNFESMLLRVKKGDVESVDHILKFYSDYVFELKRSHIKIATKRIYDLLVDCSLLEMDIPMVPGALYFISIFDNDVNYILSALNITKLADELSNSNPRNWKVLLQFTFLGMRRHLVQVQEIVDHVNIDTLIKNVERFYEDNRYEFRILIYLFCHGSTPIKEEFASKVKPFIEKLFDKPAADHSALKDIIKAFNVLSPSMAASIISKHLITIDIAPTDIPEASPLDEDVKESERLGNDYILMERSIDRRKKNAI